MTSKSQRFAVIRKIIRSELIGSQDELMQRLHDYGVEVTQSTLSRDLKYMHIAKIPNRIKGYIYILPNADNHDVDISSNISDNITGLEFSGNLAVLKTKSGYASAVSVPIDHIDYPEILGTIAGDDTILLVMREGCSHTGLKNALSLIIPNIK